MCGITGIFNFNGQPVRRQALEQMTNIISHRGPDDEGYFIDNTIGLGHRRLSIIDLSPAGHQPMPNEDGTVWLTFNGEIYNYLELMPELKVKGHIFKSRTDAEVIIHSYEEYGHECLNKFNGMWAFAIWDKRKSELFCSRDRFGVKPFYYYHNDGKYFIFGSEIKAILENRSIQKIPNNQTIYNYLSTGYGFTDCTDETFFEGVKQLKPGHYMVINGSVNKNSIYKYWDMDISRQICYSSDNEYAERFYHLFEDSVKLRLRSDVPVGICLSGGLDSSSIACIVNRLMSGKSFETFSSCFAEEKYDERMYIDSVLEATNANPNYTFPAVDHFFDTIGKIIWHQDEPYADISIYAHWHVMKLASDRGFKVLVNGQGGDETLAGYHKYYNYFFADLIRMFKWGAFVKEVNIYSRNNNRSIFNCLGASLRILLSSIIPYYIKDLSGFIKHYNHTYLTNEFKQSYEKNIFPSKKTDSILNNDLFNAMTISPLPSLLHIDDRNGMAFAIESRAPFLDYRLVEYLFSISPSQKVKNGFTKYILRNAFKTVLPEKVRLRTDKMGFATPAELWFKKDVKKYIQDILASKRFHERGYLNINKAREGFERHCKNIENNTSAIWSWVNLELWFREFFP